MDKACGNCEHWDGHRNNVGPRTQTGNCRRNAPMPFAGTDAMWPMTRTFEWCGEFRAKGVKHE
jgi:hypothetical protein